MSAVTDAPPGGPRCRWPRRRRPLRRRLDRSSASGAVATTLPRFYPGSPRDDQRHAVEREGRGGARRRRRRGRRGRGRRSRRTRRSVPVPLPPPSDRSRRLSLDPRSLRARPPLHPGETFPSCRPGSRTDRRAEPPRTCSSACGCPTVRVRSGSSRRGSVRSTATSSVSTCWSTATDVAVDESAVVRGAVALELSPQDLRGRRCLGRAGPRRRCVPRPGLDPLVRRSTVPRPARVPAFRTWSSTPATSSSPTGACCSRMARCSPPPAPAHPDYPMMIALAAGRRVAAGRRRHHRARGPARSPGSACTGRTLLRRPRRPPLPTPRAGAAPRPGAASPTAPGTCSSRPRPDPPAPANW